MRKVEFQSFGAARTVTGSRHLIRVDDQVLLLDCGLFQGHRSETRERNRHLSFAQEVAALLLSHAHIDHSGAIPALVKGGYRGSIHATGATKDLCRAMLADSAMLAEADARYLNKRRKRDQPKVEPLYTREDAERAVKRFEPHPYGTPFEALPGVTVTYRDAGHILGSAGILIEIEDGPRIYFTGDLGRRDYPILRDPEPLPEVDVVLSESTYGDREHEPRGDAEATLDRVFARAVAQKGRVFVPAFSVGRTQNLVYAIAERRAGGDFPEGLPVVVDSPLALKATEVFARHPECYDAEIKDFIGEGGEPFHPAGVHYVESRQESKALNQAKRAFVVIAGSGMCEGGRIVHHLLHGIDDPRNTVLFVGHAARNTLARRLQDGDRRVRILGRTRDVAARFERIRAFSAHADRSDLLDFLRPAKDWGAKVLLVHGDEDAAHSLATALREEGHRDVEIPEAYARFSLS